MPGNGSVRTGAIGICIHRLHTLTDILLRILRARGDLCSDDAPADESISVKIRAARRYRSKMRRHCRRGVIGRASEIGAAGDADCAAAPWLTCEPLRHLIGILRFGAILKPSPCTEG